MSDAGKQVDQAVTLLYGAAGQLDYMVMRKKLKRTAILEIVNRIEQALERLRRVTGDDPIIALWFTLACHGGIILPS